ncbi:MAG: hypothetical protein KC777_23460 [Cyanobacteria bacterium HKST-UBA02]|nr:hypothetical protein [Cyanobacteria bacterium HKST-UBA02]
MTLEVFYWQRTIFIMLAALALWVSCPLGSLAEGDLRCSDGANGTKDDVLESSRPGAWQAWERALNSEILKRFDARASDAFKHDKARRFECFVFLDFAVTCDRQIKYPVKHAIPAPAYPRKEGCAQTILWLKEIFSSLEAEKSPVLAFPEGTQRKEVVVLLGFNRDYRLLLAPKLSSR